jgi:glycopeptide antibiotics resistance protein
MRSPATLTRWCAAALLVLYTFVIARLTLFPAASESGTFDVLNRIMTRISGGRLDWSQTEVLANIALFVPAGFLLAVVLGRAWMSIVVCIAASAAIELAQQRYLPSRVPSLADVEHNGLGGLIGALLAWPVASAIRMSTRNNKHTDKKHSDKKHSDNVHTVDMRSVRP